MLPGPLPGARHLVTDPLPVEEVPAALEAPSLRRRSRRSPHRRAHRHARLADAGRAARHRSRAARGRAAPAHRRVGAPPSPAQVSDSPSPSRGEPCDPEVEAARDVRPRRRAWTGFRGPARRRGAPRIGHRWNASAGRVGTPRGNSHNLEPECESGAQKCLNRRHRVSPEMQVVAIASGRLTPRPGAPREVRTACELVAAPRLRPSSPVPRAVSPPRAASPAPGPPRHGDRRSLRRPPAGTTPRPRARAPPRRRRG